MTEFHVAADQKVQDAVDAHGGPGVTFIIADGIRDESLRLSGSNPKHNGTRENPMYFIGASHLGCEWTYNGSSDDPIHGLSAKGIYVRGIKFKGPNDASRQCGHFHAEPGKGLTDEFRSSDITYDSCRFLRRRGDGLKLSEVIRPTVINCEFDSGSCPPDSKEASIDCNKSDDAVIKGNHFVDRHIGLNFKGGGVGLEFSDNHVTAPKPIEVGGHKGTGPSDQFFGNWAAKDALVKNNTLICTDKSNQSALRGMGAKNVLAEGNVIDGPIRWDDSRQDGSPNHKCSNVTIDGVLVVPDDYPADENAYRPVTQTPEPTDPIDPEPSDPDPTPEPAPEPAPPAPAPQDPENTFRKGGEEKETIKTAGGKTPQITLIGFGLSIEEIEAMANVVSKITVQLSMRQLHKGPQLTIKGKGAASTWLEAIKLID
jgi:hypothetical protein